MRKKQKHFARLRYRIMGLFLIGIAFGSCVAEEEIISNSRKYNNEISFEQFKRETGLSNFKTKIAVNSSTHDGMARAANGDYELSDFNISTEIIKRLEYLSITSYTFRIFPNEIISTEENSIFNLTLYKKGEIWEILLLEFKPTPANYLAIENGITEKVEGEVKIIFQGDYVNNTYVTNTDAMRCATVTTITFHCEGCTPEECDYFTEDGCGDDRPSHMCGPRFTVSIVGPCSFGGGTGTSGPSSGSGPILAVGGGGYAPIDWIPVDSGVTDPVLENPMIPNVRTVDDEIANQNPAVNKTPCEQLQSFTIMDANNSNSPNLKDKIDEIKSFAGNSVPHEAIYNLMKNNNGNYATTNLVVSQTTNNAIPRFGGYFYGSIHSHWYDLYPMFSWDDVYALKKHYETAEPNNKSEAIVMMAAKDCLTCSNVSVYAIKIDNFESFIAKIDNDMINPDDPLNDNIIEKKEYANKIFKEKFKLEMTNQQLEKLFLEHFNNSGISIYKANDELTNWEKLNLSGNVLSPITNTPCN